jgi:hypothetical protein
MTKGEKRTVQGANRDTLTFVFPADVGIEALDAAFTGPACESITIEDGAESYVHHGYTVRAELTKKSVEVLPATASTAAVYEDRITVAMAQRTYAETQLADMQAALNALLTGEG